MSASRPIGFWVKTVDRLIDDQFVTAAGDTGLTRRQWQILNVVAERSGVTRAEVVRAIEPFLAPGEAIEEHLAGIKDLVAVGPDRLELTPAGRERLDQVKARSVQQLRDRVATGLTRADYDTTLRTLEQIARNLGWTP